MIHFSPAPPPVPVIVNVSFAACTNFTVEWSEPTEMVDGFDPNIDPSDLQCSRDNMTTYTCQFSRVHLGQAYTFTVSALYCGTVKGDEAIITVNLQGMQSN